MADTKLSALAQGTTPATFYYGEQGGVSQKYAGLGIFNVVDYGADATGTNDSATAIQAAVNAAGGNTVSPGGGGIVFFPPGTYKVNTAISVDYRSNAAIRFIGSGSRSEFGGTLLTTSNKIFIIYCHNTGGQGGNNPIASIEHLGFRNAFTIVSGTLLGTELADGGFGCIYMTAGTTVDYHDLSFKLNTGGICLFDTGAGGTSIRNCVMVGPFAQAGTNAGDSYGVLGVYQGTITGGRYVNLGAAISTWSPYIGRCIAEDLDIENCGSAIVGGLAPIKFWDPYTLPNGAVTNPGGYGTLVIARQINTESCGSSDSSDTGAIINFNGGGRIESSSIVNFSAQSARAFWVRNANSCIIENLYIQTDAAHKFTTAAVDLDSGLGAIRVSGCPQVINPTGTVWKLPTVSSWLTGAAGLKVDGASTNGGVTFANLPPGPAQYGAEMICTDSTVTAFGATIAGTGANTVKARWNGSIWVVA